MIFVGTELDLEMGLKIDMCIFVGSIFDIMKYFEMASHGYWKYPWHAPFFMKKSPSVFRQSRVPVAESLPQVPGVSAAPGRPQQVRQWSARIAAALPWPAELSQLYGQYGNMSYAYSIYIYNYMYMHIVNK